MFTPSTPDSLTKRLETGETCKMCLFALSRDGHGWRESPQSRLQNVTTKFSLSFYVPMPRRTSVLCPEWPPPPHLCTKKLEQSALPWSRRMTSGFLPGSQTSAGSIQVSGGEGGGRGGGVADLGRVVGLGGHVPLQVHLLTGSADFFAPSLSALA